jgi:hypothetical protein
MEFGFLISENYLRFKITVPKSRNQSWNNLRFKITVPKSRNQI